MVSGEGTFGSGAVGEAAVAASEITGGAILAIAGAGLSGYAIGSAIAPTVNQGFYETFYWMMTDQLPPPADTAVEIQSVDDTTQMFNSLSSDFRSSFESFTPICEYAFSDFDFPYSSGPLEYEPLSYANQIDEFDPWGTITGERSIDLYYDPNPYGFDYFDSGGDDGGGDPLHYYVGTATSGQPLSSPPTAPGTYTFVATSATGNVLAQGTFHIPQAFTGTPLTPAISVVNTGVYTGQPAQGELIGSDGQPHISLEGAPIKCVYYTGTSPGGAPLTAPPVQTGTYTVVAAFAGSADYTSVTSQITFSITPATPTVTISDSGGAYNGKTFPATALVAGVDGWGWTVLEGVSLAVTYYTGTTGSGTPLSGPPVIPGTYTAVASFAGSTDYTAASAKTTFTIVPATSLVSNLQIGGTPADSLASLASFSGANGANPDAGLIADSSGNLFGTAEGGGANGDGTVYEITKGSASITTLASFNGANGKSPSAGLIMDSSGDLFGTAEYGGANGYGTVFEVAHGSTTITTLASFNGTNGQHPYAGLIMDSSGDLFGATEGGGAKSDGTVFEIAHGSTNITTLASFDGTNGQYPYAGLLMDSNGDLFGTTEGGGANFDGTVYEITKGSASITTLASFNGTNGQDPYAGLIMDSSGNLFGTTESGGANNDGTVFKIVHGSTSITTLASFNGANGQNPYAGLIMDRNGDLFGTTKSGGTNGDGTLFELVQGSNNITTLASFNGANGQFSYAGLLMDSSGNLFGTAEIGGANGDGTLFELAASRVTYGTGSTTISGVVSAGSVKIPVGENVGVTLSGATFTAQLDNNDNFSVTLPTGKLSAGSYAIGISYSGDGNFTPVTTTAMLNVAPATQTSTPPTAANDSYQATTGSTLTVSAANGVLANDSDPEYALLTATLANGPSHGTVSVAADGSFTYTSGNGYLGPDSFTYVASDGYANSSAGTVSLTVGPTTLTWTGNSGNWTNTQWSGTGASYPGVTASAVISTPVVVQVTSAQAAYSLAISNGGGVTVAQGGSLVITAATSVTVGSILNVSGAFSTGGTLTVDTAGNVSGGNVTASAYEFNDGRVSANLGGPGGLTKDTAGTVYLSGNNSYAGGTVVKKGTLIVTSSTALPAGTSLTVAASGTFAFDPGVSAGASVAGHPASAVVAAPIAAVRTKVDAAAAAPAVTPALVVSAASTVTRSVGEGTPAGVSLPMSTLASAAVWGPVRSGLSVAKALNTVSSAIAAATEAGRPATVSRVVNDAVLTSSWSAYYQNVGPADAAPTPWPWAWLGAIENFWNSSNQNKRTNATVAALDKVLAQYGL